MSSSLWAQKLTLHGVVHDSLGQPVPFTNLIATSQVDTYETTFAIANDKGEYKLSLVEGIGYEISITSLGFSALKDSVVLYENTLKNYQLHQSYAALEKVIIEAKMAMIVREDTITYRVEHFKTGTERKLRELLQNLPGVEVDREGNVRVNGKTVSKLLVDGKAFFGGDVQLGVNNIPADAVAEVEAIDDYNAVAFMKDLNDSDRMAMNIKLKADKKQFVFGNIEGGGGIKERYLLHPSLFYYSAKTTFNFIGSFNNINKSPLSWEDVMRFKGGFSDFLDSPIASGNTGLNQFSSSNDIVHNKMIFGAVNFTRDLNKGWRIEGYSIAAQQKSRAEQFNHTQYLTGQNLVENRRTTAQNNAFSNFNKLRLRYQPSSSKDLAYDVIVNIGSGQNAQQIQSLLVNSDSLNQTNTTREPQNLEISQYLRYNTRPTYEHTSELKAHYTYQSANSLTNWRFDRPIFPDIIPVVEEANEYEFLHDYQSETHIAQVNFKHYWVLNPMNHIYPKAGLYYLNETYFSHDFQKLDNGDRNDFHAAGFGNALRFQLIDPYVGLQYKTQLGPFILRPGVVYHHYLWRAQQFEHSIVNQDKGVLLPELKIELDDESLIDIAFNYKMNSTFAAAASYANRLRLTSFNSLYRGNEKLENSLYHDFSLSYRDFSMKAGFNYNINVGYIRREKSIRYATRLEGIDQISTSMYSLFPENTVRLSGRINKRFSFLSTGLAFYSYLSDYTRVVNNTAYKYDSKVFRYRIHLQTRFEKAPNFTLDFTQTVRDSRSDKSENRYYSLMPFFGVDYAFLNGFILKAEYRYTYSKDNSMARGQEFQMGNASLFYRAENSPWGFEIRVNNLFDLAYKHTHFLTDFMIYDRRVYLQPRTVMILLSYRL